MLDYIRESIKGVVAENSGKVTFRNILETSAYGDTSETEIARIVNDLEFYGIIELNGKGFYTFNFGKPFYIVVDGCGYIGQVQARLAAKGYRWQERIFNDGSHNTSLQITRDSDCHWNGIYSKSILTTGWSRFERLTCWEYVSAWLAVGGFDKED